MTIGCIGITDPARDIVTKLIGLNIGVVVYDDTPARAHEFVTSLEGLKKDIHGMLVASYTLVEFMRQIPSPRVILLEIPEKKTIDMTIKNLLNSGFSQGNILIDAGKSETPDTIRRYQELRDRGCGYIDCGMLLDSPHGRFSLALGGDENAVKQLSWLWDAIAGAGSWKYAGTSGSGHYTAFH